MADTSLVFNILAKDKASKVFDGIKVAAAAAFAAGAAAAVGFGVAAINSASDLAETQSKVKVIFGESSTAVFKFAESAASSLGQSKQQALDAASTFATFGKSAGLSGEKLVGFSTDMTKLASDLASFNNTSPEQAIEAIGAALRGESEPMRAYGVLLDDASLKAKAMEMGLLKGEVSVSKVKAAQIAAAEAQRKYNLAVKEHGSNSLEAQKASAALGTAQESLTKATEGTIGSLTPQQRVLAAQALIMSQTTAAQGDFARTSDGLANKQRIMKAELANVQATIGEKLLPVALKLATWGRDAIDWMTKHKDIMIPLVAVLGTLAGIIAIIVGVTKLWTIVQTALNVVMMLNPIGLIVLGVLLLIGVIVLIATKTTWFQDIWNTVWGGIKSAAQAVGNWFAGPFAGFFVKLWNTIVNGVVNAKNWVVNTFNTIVGFVTGLPGRISSAASGMWDGIKSAFRSAINWLIQKWNNFSLTLGGGSVLGMDIPSVTLSTPNIPLLASGGFVQQSGLAVIHRGETVQPAQVTPLNRGSGPVVIEINSGGTAFDDALVEILRKAIRVRGGNAQLVLGRG